MHVNKNAYVYLAFYNTVSKALGSWLSQQKGRMVGAEPLNIETFSLLVLAESQVH